MVDTHIKKEEFRINEDEWESSCTAMKQRRMQLLLTGQWSDCRILMSDDNDTTFHTHRLILSMASPVFEKLLKEQSDIRITDATAEATFEMLKYVYAEVTDIVSFELACEVYHCAHKFKVMQLRQLCMAYMYANVTVRTACKGLELAHSFKETMLMQECLKVIELNTLDILNDKSLEDLKLETVEMIFSLENLNVTSDLVLFLALESYWRRHRAQSNQPAPEAEAEASIANNSQSIDVKPIITDEGLSSTSTYQPTLQATDDEIFAFRGALKHIRFLTLPALSFARHVARSPLLPPRDAFALLAHVASAATRVPMPPGYSTSREPRLKLPAPEKAREVVFRFTVPEINKHRSVQSAPFIMADRQWTLKMLPRFETWHGGRPERKTYLGFFLRCESVESPPWGCRVSGEFRLLTHQPDKYSRVLMLENVFNSQRRDWGYPKFVSTADLVLPSNGFLFDNSIVLEVRAVAEIITQTV